MLAWNSALGWVHTTAACGSQQGFGASPFTVSARIFWLNSDLKLTKSKFAPEKCDM